MNFEYMDILKEFNISLKIISEKRPEKFSHPFFFGSNKAFYSKWKYETFPKTPMVILFSHQEIYPNRIIVDIF